VALQYCTFNWAVTKKKTVCDGEKLLTYLNSALKLLSGLDFFFLLGQKKKLNFVDQCYREKVVTADRLILMPSAGRSQIFNLQAGV
jgi:hypothetical protein